jgi:DNA helicase-2/ATP-dependent DNA helicase PcrA
LINGKGMRGRKDQARATIRQSMEARATTWSPSPSSTSRSGATPPSRSSAQPTQPAASRQPQFKPGQRVTHGLFGEGVVIKTELADDDEYVSIAFAGKGVKKLMASLANLKVIR